MGLDEAVQEKPNKHYVAYKLTRNFAELHIQKSALMVYLRPIEYDDPHSMISRIPEERNWTLNRRLYIHTDDDLVRAQSLIEQAYRDVL